MRIIIVDDEELVRWFLERALRKWGHEVISVPNISEAFGLIKKEPFDMLFTDLRMPEGNGTSLIKKVSEIANNPKIVVCSAYITTEMAEEFHERGICTLKKPFKLDELERVLDVCAP